MVMVHLRYGLVRRTLTLGEKDNGSFLTCVASQPGTNSTFKSKKVSFRKDQQMEDFFKRYKNHRKTKKIYSLPPSLKLTNDMVNLLRKEEKVVKAEAKALNAKEFFGWRSEVLDFSLVFLLNNNKYLYMYLRWLLFLFIHFSLWSLVVYLRWLL